jgi:hypothetical protein
VSEAPYPYRTDQDFAKAVERAAAAPYKFHFGQELPQDVLKEIVDSVRPDFAAIKLQMPDDLDDLVRRVVKALATGKAAP